MSDPALLDLLEERGVLALMMMAVRNRLHLSVPFRGCSCADKEVAQFGGFPHGRRCSAWVAVSALGLLEELVELDHQRALHMSNAADDEIEHLIRGRRVNRDRVVAALKRDGWETGAFFHREVDRVMVAQAQLEARDTAREAEAEAIEGLKVSDRLRKGRVAAQRGMTIAEFEQMEEDARTRAREEREANGET